MPRCLIGVGSNLGDRSAILQGAVADLRRQLTVTAVSKWFTYAAVGGPEDQQDFFNGAVVAETELSAQEVALVLQQIEASAGRERIERWSSRTLDCDLLLFGNKQIDTQSLQVPHPRMIARRFVLEPAAEIAADMIHPQIGWNIKKLFRHLVDAMPYFCVLGSDKDFARRIAELVSNATSSRLLTIQQLTGRKAKSPIKWATAANDLLANEIQPSRGLVSNFWVWEPWLHDARLPIPVDFRPTLNPKLIIVTDPIGSDFGKNFAMLDQRLRLPTLFLSDKKHAVQDAVGSVLAMQ